METVHDRFNIVGKFSQEKTGSRCWFDDEPSFDNVRFRNEFRLSRNSFRLLHQTVAKDEEHTSTTFRRRIPLQKRICITLYVLGSIVDYQTVGVLFDTDYETVGEIVLDFCQQIWDVLQPDYLNFYDTLTDEKLAECVQKFDAFGFPQCCGVVDVYHIKANPRDKRFNYLNKKGWLSVALLAAIDYKNCFTYVKVSAAGRLLDAEVFEASSLLRFHIGNPIFQRCAVELGGSNVPVVLVGDTGFPLTDKVIKPYPVKKKLSEKQRFFNKKLFAMRRMMATTFGQVRARFRRIDVGLEDEAKSINTVIKACCLLHNFLHVEGDPVADEWLTVLDTDTECRSGCEQPIHGCCTSTPDGIAVRTAITDHLYAKNEWNFR